VEGWRCDARVCCAGCESGGGGAGVGERDAFEAASVRLAARVLVVPWLCLPQPSRHVTSPEGPAARLSPSLRCEGASSFAREPRCAAGRAPTPHRPCSVLLRHPCHIPRRPPRSAPASSLSPPSPVHPPHHQSSWTAKSAYRRGHSGQAGDAPLSCAASACSAAPILRSAARRSHRACHSLVDYEEELPTVTPAAAAATDASAADGAASADAPADGDKKASILLPCP
jgi:hypothetical protein